MPNEFLSTMRVLLAVVLGLAGAIGPFVFLYVAYILISLPLRRKERARVFLQMLELGINDGASPERAILQAASSRDAALGVRFHQLAALIETGLSLDQAIARVPRLLPAQITAMIRAGHQMGDLRRVLPACRQLLDDAVSQTRGALNYAAILAFIIVPIMPAVFILMNMSVIPKFELIAQDMAVSVSPISEFVFATRGWLVVGSLVTMFLFQALTFFYIAGPRMRALEGLQGLFDRIFWMMPWRRNRLKRDFTTMLAIALDAGVPEQKAVRLAGESTASTVFERRAASVAADLAAGASLVEAMPALDSTGELRWRFANATRSPGGFFAGLRGWFQLLDARAFQQEQTAAQVLTTVLVIVNGVIIGLFAVGMFDVLISISKEAPLW